jgi:hypothetical protein
LSGLSVGQPSWVDEHGDKPKHGNIVYFYDREERNTKKSEELGRPVFYNKTYIHKSTPGDSNVVIERPLRDADKQEWPREWALYEQKKSHFVEGTPLEAMPWLDRLQCAEIKSLNIHTVEQLINLSGVHQVKVMGYNDLKKRAENFLRVASDTALLEKKEAEAVAAKAEALEKDKRIQELELKVEALMRMVSTDRPRKPGRPRKVRGTDPTAASSPDL